jgi:DNA-binding GntR family transcriptional regulator
MSLSQRAFSALHDAVLQGRFGPGDRLVAAELAQELEVSRTPVRDALHRLTIAAVLEPSGRGGYRPRQATARDLRDVSDLRILLEPEAARAVARLAGARRASVCDALEAATAGGGPTAGHRFHTTLALACPNDSLGEAIALLNERLVPHRRHLAAAALEHEGSPHPHARVIGSIRDGDPCGAADALRAHLQRVRSVALRSPQ